MTCVGSLCDSGICELQILVLCSTC